MKLSGHTILITGGTSGIGRELALRLKASNTVLVTGRNPDRLAEATAAGLIAIRCDLTSRADIDQLLTRIEQDYPALDVLINNAGVQYNYQLPARDDIFRKVQEEIAINLTGTIQLTQALLPTLLTKPSQILNVTSALAWVPKSDGLVYSASKAGLHNFTRGLRKALKGHDVVVREIVPPVTDTGMTAGREEAKMNAGALADLILAQWKKGKKRLAPTKIRLFAGINHWLPSVADRIIP